MDRLVVRFRLQFHCKFRSPDNDGDETRLPTPKSPWRWPSWEHHTLVSSTHRWRLSTITTRFHCPTIVKHLCFGDGFACRHKWGVLKPKWSEFVTKSKLFSLPTVLVSVLRDADSHFHRQTIAKRLCFWPTVDGRSGSGAFGHWWDVQKSGSQ